MKPQRRYGWPPVRKDDGMIAIGAAVECVGGSDIYPGIVKDYCTLSEYFGMGNQHDQDVGYIVWHDAGVLPDSTAAEQSWWQADQVSEPS